MIKVKSQGVIQYLVGMQIKKNILGNIWTWTDVRVKMEGQEKRISDGEKYNGKNTSLEVRNPGK